MGVMNELINPGVVRSLERILAAAAPASSLTRLAATARELDDLSLRERTDLLSRALLADLPGDYSGTAAIFRRGLDDPARDGDGGLTRPGPHGYQRFRGLPGAPR